MANEGNGKRHGAGRGAPLGIDDKAHEDAKIIFPANLFPANLFPAHLFPTILTPAFPLAASPEANNSLRTPRSP